MPYRWEQGLLGPASCENAPAGVEQHPSATVHRNRTVPVTRGAIMGEVIETSHQEPLVIGAVDHNQCGPVQKRPAVALVDRDTLQLDDGSPVLNGERGRSGWHERRHDENVSKPGPTPDRRGQSGSNWQGQAVELVVRGPTKNGSSPQPALWRS